MRRLLLIPSALVLGITLGLGGCFLGASVPELNLEIPEWVGTVDVLVPYEVHGDSLQVLADYRLDVWDPGSSSYEAVAHIGERQIRVPSGSSGLLSFQLWESMEPFRLTFRILSTRDATAVPRPILTVERFFRIDTSPPRWDGFDPVADLNPPPGPGLVPDTEYAIYVGSLPAFDEGAAGNAPVRLYYTFDDSIPIPSYDRPSIQQTSDPMWHYYGSDDPDNQFRIRMLLVDDAGNRSDILTTPWYTE